MGPLADDMGGFMPRKPLEGTTPSERSSHDHWVGVPVFARHLQQSPTKRRTQQKRRKQAAKATGSAQRRAASASSSVAALASGIGKQSAQASGIVTRMGGDAPSGSGRKPRARPQRGDAQKQHSGIRDKTLPLALTQRIVIHSAKGTINIMNNDFFSRRKNHSLVKEQVAHMLTVTMLFTVLGGIAVLLDLASMQIRQMGVTDFTSKAIELTSHAMLLIDLTLFGLYILKTSFALVIDIFERRPH